MSAAIHRSENPHAYYAALSRVHDRLSQQGITPEDVDAAYKRGYDAGCATMSKSLGNIYIAAMVLAVNDLYEFDSDQSCHIVDKMNDYLTMFITDDEAIHAVYERFDIVYDGTDPFHPLKKKT